MCALQVKVRVGVHMLWLSQVKLDGDAVWSDVAMLSSSRTGFAYNSSMGVLTLSGLSDDTHTLQLHGSCSISVSGSLVTVVDPTPWVEVLVVDRQPPVRSTNSALAIPDYGITALDTDGLSQIAC